MPHDAAAALRQHEHGDGSLDSSGQPKPRSDVDSQGSPDGANAWAIARKPVVTAPAGGATSAARGILVGSVPAKPPHLSGQRAQSEAAGPNAHLTRKTPRQVAQTRGQHRESTFAPARASES
jgi:hypothetical protein